MIEWMQTHRKWLVITIWIATISFIGAGFVGWGQFQLNKKSSVIAEIEDTEVTIKDWQDSYRAIFNQVNQQLNGALNEELADKLGLKQQALQIAIKNGILRKYAKDLGLYITDEEVAKTIIKIFSSKEAYKEFLLQTHQKASEFESQLKKELLVQKLIKLLNLKPAKSELLAVGSSLYNEDNLTISVINKDTLKVEINETELKDFYNKHKQNYKSEEKYRIAFKKIYLNDNVDEKKLVSYYNENREIYKNEKGEILPFTEVKEKVKIDYLSKINKKKAFIEYKKLKHDYNNSTIVEVSFNNKIIPVNIMQKIIKNSYLKPTLYENYYIIAKLLNKVKPRVLTLKEAYNQIKHDLIEFKKLELLKKISENRLSLFKGVDLGFVTKFDAKKVVGLEENMAREFLKQEFSSEKSLNYILVPENNPQYSVLYRVNNQHLLNNDLYQKNIEYLENLTASLINNSLIDGLVKDLQNKYHIVTYIK